MLNFKYFICIFFIIDSISGQFLNYPDYKDLIATAALFYINPIPSDQPEEYIISELDNSFTPKSKDIKIIIHGWQGHRKHVSIAPLKYGYLANGHDAVFIADWSEAARIQYFDARYFVRSVGIRLVKILKNFIGKNNIDPASIHILGHSLGAHVAGNIGDYFNGTIGRITGLDAAGQLFESYVVDGLLPKHAKFVDCIHTAIPILGQALQRGHADFYPNYGKVSAPGCEFLDLITDSDCSHLRAPLFFAESIQLPDNFPSFPCSLKSILKERCYSKKAKNYVFMGENVSRSAKDAYFLQTNNVSPFGVGMYSVIYFTFKNNSNIEPTEASSTHTLSSESNKKVSKRTTITSADKEVTEVSALPIETTTKNSVVNSTGEQVDETPVEPVSDSFSGTTTPENYSER